MYKSSQKNQNLNLHPNPKLAAFVAWAWLAGVACAPSSEPTRASPDQAPKDHPASAPSSAPASNELAIMNSAFKMLLAAMMRARCVGWLRI